MRFLRIFQDSDHHFCSEINELYDESAELNAFDNFSMDGTFDEPTPENEINSSDLFHAKKFSRNTIQTNTVQIQTNTVLFGFHNLFRCA